MSGDPGKAGVATPPATPADPALSRRLPRAGRVLAVCAHPDDETFGLGALITAFVDAGVPVELLCLTLGEASTLGAGRDLGARRGRELGCAARVLGIGRVTLGDHPDGHLATVPLATLADEVLAAARDADTLLVFDHGGVTGHPDHQRATDAALAAAERLDARVLAWALSRAVADRLDEETGVQLVGREDPSLTHRLTVDRTRQLAAMSCHVSQLDDNPVPRHRIRIQGPVEHLRTLR